MVISDGLKKLTAELGNQRDAQILMCHIANCDMTGLVLDRNKELSAFKEELLFESLKRRKAGEPVQYITGSTEFMSLKFLVNPDVLIPRSDTETLVEFLIESLGEKPFSVIDIGTGSGCIGISLAKYCKNLRLECVDISKNALDVAKKNAELNGVSDRIKFSELDILNNVPNGKYDCLVSNPPYIRPEVIEGLEIQVKKFEPYQALYGGEDGLVFYRRIAEIAPHILNEGGLIAFEIGYDQGKSVSKILKKDFYDVKIINDLCENNRVVCGRLKGRES